MSHTGKPFHVFIISSKWRPVNNPPPPSKKKFKKRTNQNKTKTIKQTNILKPLSMEELSHHQKCECGKVSGCISFALNFLPCISMVTSVFVKCFWFIRYRELQFIYVIVMITSYFILFLTALFLTVFLDCTNIFNETTKYLVCYLIGINIFFYIRLVLS